jgi:hypothetical protein
MQDIIYDTKAQLYNMPKPGYAIETAETNMQREEGISNEKEGKKIKSVHRQAFCGYSPPVPSSCQSHSSKS